jgi:hypothetical protein
LARLKTPAEKTACASFRLVFISISVALDDFIDKLLSELLSSILRISAVLSCHSRFFSSIGASKHQAGVSQAQGLMLSLHLKTMPQVQ